METIATLHKKPKLSPPPQPTSQNLIDKLPDDCIATIFTFLVSSRDRRSCAAVSKKWLHLMAISPVFTPPSKSPPRPLSRFLVGDKANDFRVAAVAVRAYPRRTLTHLSLVGSPSVTDIGLEIVAKASPFLKSLDLWGCASVGDSGIRAVAQCCGDLERLNLIGLPLLSDCGLSSIAGGCLKLSALCVDSCPLIGTESLKAIASKSLKLKSISLAKCPLFDDSAIVFVVSKLPELERLKLERMRIGDEVLRAIRDRSRALRALQLEKIRGPTASAYGLIAAMEELETLKLRSCVGLTGESLKSENLKLTRLKEIEIQRCGSLKDEILIGLSKSARFLKTMKLDECSGFSSVGLIAALSNWRRSIKLLSLSNCAIIETQQSAPLIENFPRLTTLELKNCSGVGDDLIASMAFACKKVKYLSLVSINSITDQGVLHFNTPHNNLTTLDLSGCMTISTQALNQILTVSGKKLKTLRLKGCEGVNDSTMAAIAKSCDALEELSVERCGGVSDVSLWSLVNEGKDRLQSLCLAECLRVTDRGLKFLEEMTWDNLKLLDVRKCGGVSKQGVESFEMMIWWCRVIF